MEATRIDLLHNLSPYQGNKRLIVRYQDTNDIIKALQEAHKNNASEYDKIAPRFWNGNKKALLKRLFNFCKKNIRYEIETDQNQTIKTPGAILAQGKGDCKHYASFINGVVSACNRKYNCNIDNYFRFSGYKIGATEPQHVFAVVKNADGEEIWIDPVLENFNEHKETTYQTDKKANTMLHSVSGFGELAEIGKGGRGLKKWRNFKSNIAKGAKKVYLAAPRNAFLALTKLNAFQLAVKMAKLYKQPGGAHKLTQLWNKFGGADAALKNAINAGIKHYRFRHKTKMDLISGIEYDEQILRDHAGIGAEPVSTSALIASATPIILAVLQLLKGLKGNNANDASTTPTEAPVMTESEGYEVEEAVNGCLGAVVTKHRIAKKVKRTGAQRKAAVKKVLDTAKLIREELGIPKTKAESAVDTYKRAKATLKATPGNKNLEEKLTVFQKTLQEVKNQNATPTGAPTSIYDRTGANLPGANLPKAPTSGYDRSGGTVFSSLTPEMQQYYLYLSTHPGVSYNNYLAQKYASNLTPEQVAAQQATAQAALNQGASPLFSYAAKQAQNEQDNTPESEDKASAEEVTPQEAIEATSSAGLDNKKLFLILGAGAAIYFLTKKGKH